MVELASGEEVWRTHLTDRIEASPVPAMDGGTVLVASYNHTLYRYNLQSTTTTMVELPLPFTNQWNLPPACAQTLAG